MKRTRNIILIFFTAISAVDFSSKIPHQVILDEFYSESLSFNLIHAMKSAEVLYHFLKEKSLSKELLESELDRIADKIGYCNSDISKMVENASDQNKIKIFKYLKNIDGHLASVYLDVKTIRNELKKEKDISPVLSNIYYQLKKTEYEDHKEIKKNPKI